MSYVRTLDCASFVVIGKRNKEAFKALTRQPSFIGEQRGKGKGDVRKRFDAKC